MIYPDCQTCRGKGFVTVDWGDIPCPSCRLRSQLDEQRQRVAEREAEAVRS